MKGDFPDKDKKSGNSFGYLNKKHYLCKRKKHDGHAVLQDCIQKLKGFKSDSGKKHRILKLGTGRACSQTAKS